MPIPTQREEQHRPRKVGRARVDTVGKRIVHLGRARNAGRFVPRWTRWMVVFVLAGAVIATLFRNSILDIPGAGYLVDRFCALRAR